MTFAIVNGVLYNALGTPCTHAEARWAKQQVELYLSNRSPEEIQKLRKAWFARYCRSAYREEFGEEPPPEEPRSGRPVTP